jgi:uncharacterized protein YicC (UPF0701 family)
VIITDKENTMKRIAVPALCILIAAGIMLSAGCREKEKKDFGDVKARITELKREAMTRNLNLDEATVNRAIEVTEKYNQEKIALLNQHRENMDALKNALDSGNAADSDLKALIDALDKGEQDLISLRQQEREELSTFLTTQQLGRYLVFEDRFKKKLKRHIASKLYSRDKKR